MKIRRVEISLAAIAVLGIQLALVLSIAGKYLYERKTCPRVWARAVAFDPEMPMRGRYLSAKLVVDGCGSTLPSATHAQFPRDINGAVKPGPFVVRGASLYFPATLKVENNRLVAVRIDDNNHPDESPADLGHKRFTVRPDATAIGHGLRSSQNTLQARCR